MIQSIVESMLSEQFSLPVSIVRVDPIDHGYYGKTVFRYHLDTQLPGIGQTVIVKTRRAEVEFRSDPTLLRNEIAALSHLTNRSSRFAPRLLAADLESCVLVMDDLGRGASLEDVLTSTDPQAARHALNTFARSLAQFQLSTSGGETEFLDIQKANGVDRFEYGIAGNCSGNWERLRCEVESMLGWIPSGNVSSDFELVCQILDDPGPYLVMSNGDACPANTRIIDDNNVFLDFEGATYQHALLDVTSLHVPFPACPCWALLPSDAMDNAVEVYRNSFAELCPGILDDSVYYPQAAAACMAWAILRSVRLGKLDTEDIPHPAGFSRRGQLLETIDVAVRIARRSGTLPDLTAWCEALGQELHNRWGHAPMPRPMFRAFR